MVLHARTVSCLTHILRPLNYVSRCHIMPVVRVHVKGARELQLETADIGVFKCCKKRKLCHNRTCWQRICEIHWKLLCWFWCQWVIESDSNDPSDWHGKCGVRPLLSWHARLLNAKHWSPRWTRSRRIWWNILPECHVSTFTSAFIWRSFNSYLLVKWSLITI